MPIAPRPVRRTAHGGADMHFVRFRTLKKKPHVRVINAQAVRILNNRSVFPSPCLTDVRRTDVRSHSIAKYVGVWSQVATLPLQTKEPHKKQSLYAEHVKTKTPIKTPAAKYTPTNNTGQAPIRTRSINSKANSDQCPEQKRANQKDKP